MAVGGTDGSVRVFETWPDGRGVTAEPRALCALRGGGGAAAVVSVAFHATDADAVVAGTADGRVWRFAVAKGVAVCRVELERARAARRPGAEEDAATIAWAVAMLPDYTLVSGDSLGYVTFSDGAHGTLIKAFRAHEHDVLAVAASADGTAVVASGIDNRIARFEHVALCV